MVSRSPTTEQLIRPRLLDLFCGAGGAAMGYSRAGFEVVGVDIKPQPRFPFPDAIQKDALNVLGTLNSGGFLVCNGVPRYLRDFDAIHASPPCQAYTQAALSQRNAGKVYPDLLAETRTLLEATGLPWVIENVLGAPMRADIVMCGCMVGLELRRERWFETSWHDFHMLKGHDHRGPVVSVVGHGTPSWVRQQLGRNPTIADYRAAMGIDWMNRDELSQAIPPPYTEYVGERLVAALRAEISA